MAASDYVSLVQQFYVGFYGRPADTEGVAYWSEQVDAAGGDFSAVLNAFAASDEAQEFVYKDPATGDDYTNEQLIENIYQNLFSRAADPEGLAFYLAELDGGTMSLQTIVKNIVDGAQEGSADKAAIDNKVTVATYFTDNLGDTPYTADSIVGARAVIAAVDSTDASVDAGRADADEQIASMGGGEDFVLTTAVDVIEGTSGNDFIEGVSSSLSSEKTLNPADEIDGAEGTDTADFTMKGSFAGFSGDGFMKNVEKVNLISESNIARDFDATGVTGVEEYAIDATKASVNLKDLGDLDASISLSNLAKGTFSVAYATDITAGTADVQALAFNNVGTVDDADTDANEEQVVGVTIAGVEELNVAAAGDNVVSFTAAATEDMTIEGDGNLKMTVVPAALKTLDASAATGDLDIDLTAAADVTLVSLGAGDDTLTLGTGDVTKNAELSGGAGNNTLEVAASGTVQFVQSGFQTLELANTVALTYSATNASDIETIVVGDAATASTTFANLGSADYAVEAVDNNNGLTLTTDHSGTTTLTIADADATEDAPATNDTIFSFGKSATVDMTVAENMTATGNVTATKASSVDINIQGTVTGSTLAAAAATGIVVSAVENDSTLVLNTAKATDLNVTAAADLDLTTSTLTALESLTVNTDADFDLSGVALAALATATLEGEGSVELNNLGAITQDGYAITVTATGLSGADTAGAQALEVGSINTKGQDITVDASGVLGEVTIGAISAVNGATTGGNVIVDLDGVGDDFTLSTVEGNNVTIDAGGALGTTTYDDIDVANTLTLVGAELVANDWTAGGVGVNATGESLTANITGGIDNDTLTIVTADANDTADITVSGDLGIGTNTVTIDASLEADVAVTIDASGLTNVTTANLLGGAEADTIKGTDGNDTIVTYGESDTLTGGDGTDTFAINVDLGTDGVTITDFETASDAITLAARTGIAATSSNVMTTLSGNFGNAANAGALAATIAAGTLGAVTFAISGADLTAAIAGQTVAASGNVFRLLFLDTDGDDQGLYIVSGAENATGTALTASMVTATVNVVLTGSNDIVASDITFI